MSIDLLVFLEEICKFMRSEQKEIKMRRGKWVLREQTEIVDNVDKSVQNSIFPKKGKKWVCKTYPQNWGQNVDNVDNKKVEHIFCATCLVYHKVGGLAEEKTFYLDRQGGSVLQQVPLFVYGGSCFMAGIFRVRQVRLISAGRVRRINVKKS